MQHASPLSLQVHYPSTAPAECLMLQEKLVYERVSAAYLDRRKLTGSTTQEGSVLRLAPPDPLTTQ